MLTCVRKLASLCLALDLAVTARWIPIEINVSDRPSRIHDPSDIGDKTMTNLLTKVVRGRTHRDEMMAQRDSRETASMIQNRNGTPRATSFEAGRKHCASEAEKSEAVAARGSPGGKHSEPFTDVALGEATLTRNLETPADEENAGDWSEKDSDGTSSTDGEAETKRKQKRLEQSARGRARVISKAGEGPTLANLSFLERVSVSHGTEAKYKKRVEQFLSFADEGKTGARRGRRGRRGNRAVPEYEQQPRTTSERWRGPTGGASVLPTSERKVGRTKTRSVVECSEGLEKEGSDTIKTTITNNDLVRVCWEMARNKKLLMSIHVLMMVVTYCRPGELLQSMREDLVSPMHGVGSLLLHPVQRGMPSKTQSNDYTIDLKSQISRWITKVAAVLAAGRPSREDLRVPIRRLHQGVSARALGLKVIVPYQCHHSGASWTNRQCSRTHRSRTYPVKLASRLVNLILGSTLTARMQRTCYDLGMQRER